MSTRSYICKETTKGQYVGIYCHSDGYLAYNGAMLLDYYNKRETVNELLALGNLSCLNKFLYPDPNKPHSFDERQTGVTVAYKRDRGEQHQQAQKVKLQDIDSPSSWIDYCYVFGRDNKWRYFVCGHLKEGLKDLQSGLDEEYKKLGFPRPAGYYGFYTDDDLEERRKAAANETKDDAEDGND